MYLETYWEGIEVEPGIVAIEWSERLGHLPPAPIELSLSYVVNDVTGEMGSGRQAELVVPESIDLSMLLI